MKPASVNDVIEHVKLQVKPEPIPKSKKKTYYRTEPRVKLTRLRATRPQSDWIYGKLRVLRSVEVKIKNVGDIEAENVQISVYDSW